MKQNGDIPDFNIVPIYDSFTDSILVYLKDRPSYGKYINEFVTLFLDSETDEIIGIEISNFSDRPCISE